MKDDNSFEKRIKTEIPESSGLDEFWSSGTEDGFINAAITLKSHGMNEDEIIEFLSDLYSLCSNEFGA